MSVTKHYLEIYQDLEVHCDNCVGVKVGSNQPAARAMNLRNMGYAFEKYGNKYETRLYCDTCKKKTPHRKLLNKEPVNQSAQRFNFSSTFRKRILKVLDCYDPIERRQLNPSQLEVDHREPFLRFKVNGNEIINEATISDDEIASKYMLLNRSNNLLKSRNCEKCERTGIRQPSKDGIEYFYSGKETYENSCIGCFWYDPETWRYNLNEKLGELNG